MKKPTKLGRPTKYRPIYCKKIIKFFQIPATKTMKETFYYKNGDEKVRDIEVANDFPTLFDFAFSIGVDDDTLERWAKKYKAFRGAYYKAKKMQESIWLKNSMRGLYNPQFAIFAGKNIFTGYKDKSEVDTKHTGTLTVVRKSNI